MNMVLNRAWEEFPGPLLQRPKRQQVAALCHRGDGQAREYLIVTSRETRRWIIPKGWPIRGLLSSEAALQEAWEEAGVKTGAASAEPIGRFTYNKTKPSGWSFPVETLVYSVAVKDVEDDFPEAGERTLKWVDAQQAAQLLSDAGLAKILHDLEE